MNSRAAHNAGLRAQFHFGIYFEIGTRNAANRDTKKCIPS